MPTLKATGVRRRTTPLETAHASQSILGMHSRLPSPPDDEMDISSDDTITASGMKTPNKSTMELNSGIPSGRASPTSSVVSRLSSTPATRAASSLHSSQSSPTYHRRTPSLSLSPSSSSEDDTRTITEHSHAHASTSTWGELPILITFVSPAVALLTGGDYLKDVLLTCFLAWYLHQLIKVPWDIYLASLPPSRPFSSPRGRKQNDLAHSHLNTTRLLALLLSALTPFLGAWLLTVGASLLSPGTLSWFSTSLFVLAAGVRPWRHLTHVLLTRTDALHLAAHRSAGTLARLTGGGLGKEKEKELMREREKDRAKIDSLETDLVQLRAEMGALSARTRALAKSLKDADRRAGTVQGRVEVLERHGNGNGQLAGAGGGIWDGLGMIGVGVIALVHGTVYAMFPFMSEPAGSKGVGSKERKKAKRLRGVVNNLPPVPEVDESLTTGLDANGVRLDGKGRDGSGLYPPMHSTQTTGVVEFATWPLRAMRGVLMGFARGVTGR